MICVIPMLRQLKERFPEVSITLIASHLNYEIMKHNPWLDHAIEYDKFQFQRAPTSILDFFQSLRGKKYDYAIVPATVSVSVTSDLLARISGATVRIGAKNLNSKPNPTAFCYTHGVDLDWSGEPRRHQALRNMDVLTNMIVPTADLRYEIGITDAETSGAKERLRRVRGEYPLLIGFHPGAGKKENRWSTERFASIANRVCSENNGCAIITSGPKDDAPLAEVVRKLQCPYLIIQKEPIRTVAAIINELDFFVSNDTGIMHVAGGTKTTLLALFGPTDPLQWAPQGSSNHYIASPDRCIDSITEEEVYTNLRNLINHKNS